MVQLLPGPGKSAAVATYYGRRLMAGLGPQILVTAFKAIEEPDSLWVGPHLRNLSLFRPV